MSEASTQAKSAGDPEHRTTLKRGITGTLLFFFILGDTLGAGIYALMGTMAKDVGGALWLPLCIALVVALLTAGTYAELITKYPHAGGAARYIDRAFKIPYLSFLVGFLMLSSGITTSAALANAFAGDYLAELVDLPAAPVTVGLLAILTLINLRGVQESMRANMVMALIETSGLVLIIVLAGVVFARGDGDTSRLLEFPADVTPLAGVFAASTIAFFSFLGFEAAANMAEEVQNPSKVYPKALFGAIGTAAVVYLLIAVGTAIVLDPADIAESTGPLLEVVRAAGFQATDAFAVVALIAVTNGALLFMVMASRATYGLAEAGLLPRMFARIQPTRRTPWVAIVVIGLATIGMSFVGDVGTLADTTVLLLLLVFISANISVIALRDDRVDHDHFTVPKFIPVVAILASIVLLANQRDPKVWGYAVGYLVLGSVLFLVARATTKDADRRSLEDAEGL